jgi:hypothetical protein
MINETNHQYQAGRHRRRVRPGSGGNDVATDVRNGSATSPQHPQYRRTKEDDEHDTSRQPLVAAASNARARYNLHITTHFALYASSGMRAMFAI